MIPSSATPAAYLSPSRISGSSADRAVWNGGRNRPAANSIPISAPGGSPGTTIAPTSTVRIASQHTIPARRGSRSASADSAGPPITQGAYEIAKAAAARPADFVVSNTRKDRATLASWSPASDSPHEMKRYRYSRTPSTSR